MAADCNQVITITGGPGETSVQSVDYNKDDNTILITKADGSTQTLYLIDNSLDSVTRLANGDIEFLVKDGFGRSQDEKRITLDMSEYGNVQSDYTETDTANMAFIKNKPDDLVRKLQLDSANSVIKWVDELGKPHTIDLSMFEDDCAHVTSGYVDPSRKELILVTTDPNVSCGGQQGHIIIDATAFFDGGGTGPGATTFVSLTDTANTMGTDGQILVVNSGTIEFADMKQFEIDGGHFTGQPLTNP